MCFSVSIFGEVRNRCSDFGGSLFSVSPEQNVLRRPLEMYRPCNPPQPQRPPVSRLSMDLLQGACRRAASLRAHNPYCFALVRGRDESPFLMTPPNAGASRLEKAAIVLFKKINPFWYNSQALPLPFHPRTGIAKDSARTWRTKFQ